MTLLLDNAAVRRVLRIPAAIAALVASFSCEAGIGRELPTEWFTQEEKP